MKDGWYKWFAWRPVMDSNGHIYWLTYVWRKDVYSEIRQEWHSSYWPYEESK